MNPENIYPRTNDHETVYLKNVIKNPNILVGDFTMYNDFAYDPRQFERIISEAIKRGFGILPTRKNLRSGSRPKTEILREYGHTPYACSHRTRKYQAEYNERWPRFDVVEW